MTQMTLFGTVGLVLNMLSLETEGLCFTWCILSTLLVDYSDTYTQTIAGLHH